LSGARRDTVIGISSVTNIQTNRSVFLFRILWNSQHLAFSKLF
jgi:hypothetical protein